MRANCAYCARMKTSDSLVKSPAPVGAVRINISLPKQLAREISPLLASRGYAGLSDYVRSCLRRDAGLELGR